MKFLAVLALGATAWGQPVFQVRDRICAGGRDGGDDAAIDALRKKILKATQR